MQEYEYISIPVSYLEDQNITKKSFMQNSLESQDFLENLLKNLPQYLELKNTFLIKSSFVLALGKKQNIIFENAENFNSFCDFLLCTKFKNQIQINENKKEISINKDISPIFYNILNEFWQVPSTLTSKCK